MTQRFIVRMVDASGALLAWAEVYATAKPQDNAGSCPFFATPEITQFTMEQDGLLSSLSVHWPDLHVARVRQFDEPIPVKAGQVYNYNWFVEPVWLVPGMRDVVLQPVTVRAPQKIGVPVGSLNAVAT